MTLSEELESRLAARAEANPEPEPEDDALAADLPEGEEVEAPEGEEAAEEEVTSFLEFGKQAGWTPEELYGLKFRLDTGEEVAIGAIKDRLQEYSRERSAVQEQTQRLEAYQRQLQEQAQSYFQQRQAEGQEAQEARVAMQTVEARYNSVDWDRLAQADPGRAAYLQQQLATDYAGAKQGYQNALAKEQHAAAQMAEQSRAREVQSLLQTIPEWRDPAKVRDEYPAMQQYLVNAGFRPNELETIYDHRAIAIARKAFLYDQGQTKMQETKEKIKAAPKPVVKPGTGGLRGAAEQAHVTALAKKARETGTRADKAAAAAAVLNRAFKR